MFISTENEQISVPSNNGCLESAPMESNPDSSDGLPPVSYLSDSPPLPATCTDVNVVPEHEKNQLQQSICSLEGEIAQLKVKQKLWDEKRREALNKIIDIKGSIRVFCRVRPFLVINKRRIREPISAGSEKIVVKSSGARKEFEFDKVFPQETSQENIFAEVEPILRSALDGHNVCVFAHGQTGTGKTFTMDGTNEEPGIIPRALREIFSQASLDCSSSLTFSMSMLEVYMGNLRDLLSPKAASRPHETVTRCNLSIQTDTKGFIEIEGLTEVPVLDFAKARWWYNRGKRVRSTAWTNVNEASSRSHCLTRITIFRHGDALEAKREVSKLWLVDLGGSERLLKTGATGLTLDEGRAINLSLSSLGDVIAALRRKRGHVPYRNSKLTQILKDSLGHGSKVLMLVHVSPCEEDVAETICSLSFAKRARAIENNRDISEDLKKQKEKRIKELENDMREAEEECQKVKNQIQKAELLLHENIKLFSTTHRPSEDEEAPISPKEVVKEVIETPRKPEKASRGTANSLPRFMTSTAASRHRQNAVERQIAGKARSLRSYVTKSSIQFSASQSMSYSSDARFRAILKNSNRKSRYSLETDTVPAESPRCPVPAESPRCHVSQPSKAAAPVPRSKLVTSSDPNLKVMLNRHRRRMSDLI
ncbi:putative minus-end-directed kinesin ATPase [Rosa chinensis]|uniref:Putative minus-end-directed kinesin ATPase n=1 Tax=Rosa chinensis TaxID=74649 RepID=A0A2P6R6A8_ROSCH|nr:kinesin-like protein KIN-14U [Rosa chinensis]XP_040373192.1 kinesin-like protein KIN-14U [Rosa chinensis]PRQ41964.1 putative minus-end-directed kinesin ATPase [Rosa chinensis]